MTTENVVPQINGRDLKLANIDGPNGRFVIAYAGTRKESDDGFFYQDERGRFGFYAALRIEAIKRWDVTSATTGAWSGVPFKTSYENELTFRQNIEFFFKTRRVTDPTRLGDGSYTDTPVTFSWRIV